MAQFLVRHALVQYRSKNALGQETYETAFRGMTVELTDQPEIDRLKGFGAIIEPDEHLTRPGRMLTLPETATDSEILSWVTGATVEETEMLVRERPVMADRILAAQEGVKQRFAEQAEHLGGLKAIAAEAEAGTRSEDVAALASTDNGAGLTPAPQPSATETPAVNNPGDVPRPLGPVPGESSALSVEEADKVVAEGARSVAEYLSENPTHAKAVLEAENRRGEGPRPTVVRAVQAAASFAGQ